MDEELRMPQWNEVLLAIYKSRNSRRYCQRLNRQIKGSLTHLRNIIQRLAAKELIEIETQSKIKQITLTEKGQRIAARIQEIKCELS